MSVRIDENNREKEIFNAALEIDSPEARLAYVLSACGDGPELRERIETLLKAYDRANGFLPDRSHTTEKIKTVAYPLPLSEGPGTVIDRYKLLQLLGEGGFGAVYMAEQREPVKRRVALKIIKLGMDTKQVVARFEAERQALALMDHPNIAKVLDGGATTTGRPYFVMELVRGVRITDYCDQAELPTKERLNLFIKVCQAIQHAHQKGIVHRDLKPSNIMVTLHDGVPVPKVIDFGIAKATTEQLLTDKTLFTAVGQFLGTPAYMSPEQAELSGLDIDTRTDVYSLGVLLYELLTAKTPFDSKALLASGLDAMRRTIREIEPTRPSTRLSTLTQAELADTAKRHHSEPAKLTSLVRGDLDWIVMKALEKDRSRRYDSADALAMDIQRHLQHEPILARRASTWDRGLKWARRRPAAAALAGVIAVASVACAVLAVYATKQALFATRKAEEADRAREDAVTAKEQEQQQRHQVQRNVVRQYLANGTRLMNQGDFFSALLWYVEALRLDAGDAAREGPHRTRIASVLQHCPKLLNVFFHGTANVLHHAEFSPEGDRLATASADHTARVWDVTTGQYLLILRHDDEVNDVAFSLDGHRILTSSRDRTARVWDAGTGALLHSLSHADAVWRACFSADGRLIATACEDHTAQLWNALTGERIGTPLRHDDRVQRVTFSPDGRLLGTATASASARIWDVREGQERFKRPHNGSCSGVVFGPDSRHFLTCDGPNLRVWDATTFEEASFSPLKLGGAINEIGFSPDGNLILAGAEDFSAQVWDATTGQRTFPSPVHHSGGVMAARFSPDGRSFITAGEDSIAQLWSARTGEPIGPSLKPCPHIKSVRFNSDGRRLLFNSFDQIALVWDLTTGDLLNSPQPLVPNEHRLLSPTGQFRLAKGEGNSIEIVEASSGRKLATLPHTNEVTYASFNADGNSVITASEQNSAASSKRNELFLWDVPTGRRLNTVSMEQNQRVIYVAFTPGRRNQRMLTCGLDFTARVWDARTGEAISPPLHHGQRVNWGAFSPDGQSVVTASSDKTVRIWEPYTGDPLVAPLQHRAAVVGAFWSDNDRCLNTLTEDGYLQGWDLAGGEPLTAPTKIQTPIAGPVSGSRAPQLRADDDTPRDMRPLEDLLTLSQMLEAAKISRDGNVVPIESDELSTAWELLRKKYPNQFHATAAEMAAWHDRQARDSESEANSSAAAFHRHQAEHNPQAQTAPSAEWNAGSPPSQSGLRSLRIPPRDPDASNDQIDLSRYYNLGLHDSLTQKPDGYDLSLLPDGLQLFGGVLFDVRGVIHLTSKAASQAGQNYPESVEGIRVGRKCQRLHLLQAAHWEYGNDPKQVGSRFLNTRIGSYFLNYANGQRSELEIVYGRDLAPWLIWKREAPKTLGGATAVWTTLERRWGGDFCLYKNTRENPHPDQVLLSIDFVSSNAHASPFLIAITVE